MNLLSFFKFFVVAIILSVHKLSLAIPMLPFGLELKPYVLTDWNFYTSQTTGNLLNFNIGAGLRVHKYFGAEFNLTLFKGLNGQKDSSYDYDADLESTSTTTIQMKNISVIMPSISLMGYYPIVDILNTNIEVYGGIGYANYTQIFDASITVDDVSALTYSRFNSNALKLSTGLQAKVFGVVAARIGVDYFYDPKYDISIALTKVGVLVYLM